MSCALQGDSKYTRIDLHYESSTVSNFISLRAQKHVRQYTVAEHWTGFESQSDNPSTWEEEKILRFLFDHAESADVHACRGVTAPYVRKDFLNSRISPVSSSRELWHSSQEPGHSKFRLQDSKFHVDKLMIKPLDRALPCGHFVPKEKLNKF